MSLPFTTLTRGADLRSTNFRSTMTIAEMQAITSMTIMDEVYLAYIERTFPASGATPSGSTAQEILAEIQTWMEGACLGFVNHVTGPLNAGSNAFLYFTLATWRSAAGLNVNGFRRSTDKGKTFEYGLVQRGDNLGWWIYEDLQKGFSALKWTMMVGSNSITSATKFSSDASWPGSWSETYNNLYVAADHPPFAWRNRGKSTISPTGDVARSADVYLLPSKSTDTFYDFDSYGMIENQMFLFQSFASLKTTPLLTNWIGNIETRPVHPGSPVGEWFVGCERGNWLLKWDFTNAD